MKILLTNSRRPIQLIAGAIIAAMTASCASIVTGRTQELSFRTNPEGATVTIAGRPYGTTPITATLRRESGLTATFSKPGYKPLTVNLETGINGWFWGNIVLGGLIGSTTDGVTGAVHQYSPGQYMVTLEPENTNAVEGKPSLSDAQKAREFIVVAYDKIIIDLNRGQGEYLKSLLDTLSIPEDQRPEAIKKIQALSAAYTNIADFAEKVVEMYVKR